MDTALPGRLHLLVHVQYESQYAKSATVLLQHAQLGWLTMTLCVRSVEYNMSYAYHAISSYFNRDNVALPGFVSYFRDASIEERDHAQQLMDFQVTVQRHLRHSACSPVIKPCVVQLSSWADRYACYSLSLQC